MGIDIYAKWKTQREDEEVEQMKVWLTATAGRTGYLREAYHGEPYATQFLCAESFEGSGQATIPAAVLRERLPHALELVEEREHTLYKSSPKTIEDVKQSFRDFVALCEEKEEEQGDAVLIVASY